jgi:hypothetical protein
MTVAVAASGGAARVARRRAPCAPCALGGTDVLHVCSRRHGGGSRTCVQCNMGDGPLQNTTARPARPARPLRIAGLVSLLTEPCQTTSAATANSWLWTEVVFSRAHQVEN